MSCGSWLKLRRKKQSLFLSFVVTTKPPLWLGDGGRSGSQAESPGADEGRTGAGGQGGTVGRGQDTVGRWATGSGGCRDRGSGGCGRAGGRPAGWVGRVEDGRMPDGRVWRVGQILVWSTIHRVWLPPTRGHDGHGHRDVPFSVSCIVVAILGYGMMSTYWC